MKTLQNSEKISLQNGVITFFITSEIGLRSYLSDFLLIYSIKSAFILHAYFIHNNAVSLFLKGYFQMRETF